MNSERALLLLLTGCIILNVSWTAAVNHRAGVLEDRIDTLESDQEAIAVSVGANRTIAPERTSRVSVLAYDSAENDAETVLVETRPLNAEGLYIDVADVALRQSVQDSLRVSWHVATESEVPPETRGAVVTLHAPSEWESVAGGSASLSMAIALGAMNACARVNRSVVLTGGLLKDGSVTNVDYIREKAIAARNQGFETLIVPHGQSVEISGLSVVPVRTFNAAADIALDQTTNCARA